MGEKLLLVPWMFGSVYSSIPLLWFAIHPVVARWRRMSRSPYRWLVPLWAALIVGLAFAAWPWRGLRIYSTPLMWLPAAWLFFAGISTYSRIGADFGHHNFTGESELRPGTNEQGPITTGLHARMRHPIYFAHLAMFAAWTIGSGLAVLFVLFAVSAFITFPLMIHLEERELEQRFGAAYREYKARVPSISLTGLMPASPLGKPSLGDPRKSS
jgi:protein-S-isoprenylcysteine O-methyltransferase Ste14